MNNKDFEKEIANNMQIKGLGEFACPYEDAIRLNPDEEDFRPSFYRDIDRIIYSLAYTRYLDKTQVYTHAPNDHLSRRMTHVQFVSKIARTIGRALNLNEDLIEASALGHDLGHTPFGHLGESILNEISLEHNEGYFNHNIQSVRLLMDVENHGKGLNITLQVLDAIMCHNGEIALGEYHPVKKTKKEFLEEYHNSYKDKKVILNMRSMTLEGCVVRISDLIAYLGKDVEDAIRVNKLDKNILPEDITSVLGSTNKEIVNNIIIDIIKNSYGKNYIKLSDRVYNAIQKLKQFNYTHIYNYSASIEEKNKMKLMFNTLFDKYLDDLNNNNEDSTIINHYLKNMSKDYQNNNTKERIVIDYIAGMTDEYLCEQYNKIK